MALQSLFNSVRDIWRPQSITLAEQDLRFVVKIRERVDRINRATDDALQQQAVNLKQQTSTDQTVAAGDLLVDSFALATEAIRRITGLTLYDVQLLGGIVLARGGIAEIATGEGKTLTAVAPAFLHAVAGNGVHVMTVNSYLAERDFEGLTPAYNMLGLTVGLLRSDDDQSAKQAAYASDVTIGPGYEFGFDYLRDQIDLFSRSKPQLGEAYRQRRHGLQTSDVRPRQRGHSVAIVDEADSVMIDEATTPLVLAEGGAVASESAAAAFVFASQLAAEMDECDYEYAAGEAKVSLTAVGEARVTNAMPRGNNWCLNRPWRNYVEQSLHARLRLARDVDYIVRDDLIMLVDRATGRIFPDRTWRDGLHQAVQAKEGVPITNETQTLARISRQRYLGLYNQLSGMTGTAMDAANELSAVYGLEVTAIPRNRPCQRKTLLPRFFGNSAAKDAAIVESVRAIHCTRQPILIGTADITSSQRLAQLLTEAGVCFQLLNGVQDADEAAVIASAGQADAVTIATNMAGRGTDIRLGEGVAEIGGLHVVAAEAHESVRVDQQLVGRAARQGDPGSSQLFVSADDRLLADHGRAMAERMHRKTAANGEIASDLSTELLRLQQRVQRKQAAIRSQLFAHDDWLEHTLQHLNGDS